MLAKIHIKKIQIVIIPYTDMRRDIMSKLLEWKNNPEKKPLIIRGVRQCGKTYIMKEFGKDNYSDVAYFNFEQDDISKYFEQDLVVERLVKTLGIHRSKSITEDTLIVFDEIQTCPRAITSLKYFCEDRRFDVMCAGSLLGIKLAESSPPVGKVEEITMYPLSFREFLLANGEEQLISYLETDGSVSEISLFTDRLEGLYKEYLAVGGLPEVVSSWINNHDPARIESLSRSLISGYIDDITRHSEGKVKENGETVWKSIPGQLSRDNNKFILGHVKEGVRARDLWSSIDWLSRAGLVHLVPITSGIGESPAFTADYSTFKLYCFDTGILRVLADVPISAIVNESQGYELFRGACTENFVLLEIRKMTESPIYCWRSGNKAEVDFLLRMGDSVIPIEVKSGNRMESKSLGRYLDSHSGRGIIASNIPLTVKDRVTFVPFYAMWILEKIAAE